MKKAVWIITMLAIAVSLFAGCQETDSTVGDPDSSSAEMFVPDSSSVPETPASVPPTQAPTTPTTAPTTPSTAPATAPTTPVTTPATKPTEPKDDTDKPSVIASEKWDGGPVTWKITADGVLTISGNKHIQEKFTYIWKDYSDVITRIVVEDGITTVPNNAFSEMKNVTSVYLGKTVKSIGRYAFYNCSALTAVTIPEETESIAQYAFANCSRLAELSFAEGSKLATIESHAFEKAGIQAFVAPAQLQTIEAYAFKECPALESIRLNEALALLEAKTFQNCKKLKDVYIGGTETRVGTYIFDGCTALTTLENHCRQLRNFQDFPNLTTVIIGGDGTTVGDFKNCTSLTSVTILAPVRTINGSAFWGCTSLKEFTIPDTVTTIENSAFRRSGLTEITIPSTVTAIGTFAFVETPLQKITFAGDYPITDKSYSNIFTDVTATAYYPANNETWTEELRQDYGGTITWVAYGN